MAYYQAQAQPESQPLPGYAQSSSPAYDQKPVAPRVLHVYHEGFTHRRVQILDSDKRTPVYRINANSGGLFSSKPHLRIYEAATDSEIATITFHSISSDIDMTIQNRPILLSKSGFFTSAHGFQSLATGGSFKWKSDGVFSCGDMICLDEREQLVARFKSSGGAMKKEGKFELGEGVNGVLMTEVVVSGIAMYEYMRRQRNCSSAAAGAAGSAGAS